MDSPQRTQRAAQGELTDTGQGQQLQADWTSTLAEPQGFVWYTTVLIALCGVVSFGTGRRFFLFLGLALMAIGGTGLALLAFVTEFRLAFAAENRSVSRSVVIATSALAFIVAVAIGSNAVPTSASLTERLAILAIGLQALFLTIDYRPTSTSLRSRATLLVLSHGVVLTASTVTLVSGTANGRAAVLLYTVGFSFLSLNAFWSRQERVGITPPRPKSRRRYWESLLLLALIGGGLSAVVVVFLTPDTTQVLRSPVGRVAVTCLGAAGVVALAILSVPESPPRLLQVLTTPAATIVQHVLTLLVLANTLCLALFFVLPESFVWLAAGLSVLVCLGITVNYLSLGYSVWRGRDPPATTGAPATPLTVVVSAANEAAVLPETLWHNLAALPGAEFLLVPAAHATDGTEAVMERAREAAPDRVRIVPGRSGSKAGDLNQVWEEVDTPYVLLLDADETVTPGAVGAACDRLDADPELGIVQGRKAAAYPDLTALSRYVTVERQHSTWIDHPFVSGVLDASHFAGSAAVLRREVLPAVDGLRPDALTEDIDLSVRLYLETDWEIAYETEIVFRELNPKTWLSLIRQRERWSRGWAQVTVRYLEPILVSRAQLSLRRTAGLCWELLTAVSAPVYTLFPALIVFWVLGPTTPPLLTSSLLLGVYLGVERGLSFSIAAFRDPEIPLGRTPRGAIETLLFGYTWLLFAWVVQLHSLYLQLAGATESWDITEKHIPEREGTNDRSRTLLDPR